MAELQERHWWYQARRAILCTLLRRHAPAGPRAIVEIGCGPGGNLPLLASFGAVTAVEASPLARALVPRAFQDRVRDGALPDRLPLEPQRSDWVCLFDVLEHVDEDGRALAACRQLLAPGGAVIVTVPAYRWLWSAHDRLHHHKRRYTQAELAQAAHAAGLRIAYGTHFNTVLFPLAMLARWRDRLGAAAQVTGLGVPPGWLNGLLRSVFASERAWLRYGRLPFGLSIFAVLVPA